MPISEAERERRLDVNGGALRERIKNDGYEALWNVITNRKKQDHVEVCKDLRFLADSWIDINGDVVSAHEKVQHYLRRGIEISEEDLDFET